MNDEEKKPVKKDLKKKSLKKKSQSQKITWLRPSTAS